MDSVWLSDHTLAMRLKCFDCTLDGIRIKGLSNLHLMVTAMHGLDRAGDTARRCRLHP